MAINAARAMPTPIPVLVPVLDSGFGDGVELLEGVLVVVALTEDGPAVREAEADSIEVCVGTCKVTQVSIRNLVAAPTDIGTHGIKSCF